MNKSLFEDFTTLKWVKWTTRQPGFNGFVYCRWNGKYTSSGMVNNKQLMKLEDDKTTYHVENGKIIADYTKEQLGILEELYWLEETHDFDAFDKYRNDENK